MVGLEHLTISFICEDVTTSPPITLERVKVFVFKLLGDPSPIPWAGEEDVIFIAEQVSHHPPITAFYAESLKKRIQMTGHVLAKSSLSGQFELTTIIEKHYHLRIHPRIS